MRDHHKLRAFQLADEAALMVYRATKTFPKDEQYGLTAQMRRAAVSVASNIVEGCARRTEADYLRFLDMAYGSLCELQYQTSLSERLGYLQTVAAPPLKEIIQEASKVLSALIRSLRNSK
jgi:four helix bundle protein